MSDSHSRWLNMLNLSVSLSDSWLTLVSLAVTAHCDYDTHRPHQVTYLLLQLHVTCKTDKSPTSVKAKLAEGSSVCYSKEEVDSGGIYLQAINSDVSHLCFSELSEYHQKHRQWSVLEKKSSTVDKLLFGPDSVWGCFAEKDSWLPPLHYWSHCHGSCYWSYV